MPFGSELRQRILSWFLATTAALLSFGALCRGLMLGSSTPAAPVKRAADDEGGEGPPTSKPKTELKGRGSFPLPDLPSDALMTALDLLSAKDLSKAALASRRMVLTVVEVQRRPSLVTEVGRPDHVFAALGQNLTATPTLGFLFGTSDLEEYKDKLSKCLPLGCNIIGARSEELQALVHDDDAAPQALKKTSLKVARGRSQLAMQLGSFPDAEAKAFYITKRQCVELSRAPSDAAALALLQNMGHPVGQEWKTIVLIFSGTMRCRPDRIVGAFQRASHSTAILGGIAGRQLLLHTRGCTRIEEGGIAGLGLKGDVPLTALVSRGCKPVSPSFRTRGARILEMAPPDDEEDEEDEEDEAPGGKLLVIPELVGDDGGAVQPEQVYVQVRRRMPMWIGTRFGGQGGFMLHDADDAFQHGGAMLIPMDMGMGCSSGSAEQDPNPDDCEVGFYMLDPDESRNDLQQLLNHVHSQCEERQERTLGAVMFTCSARRGGFFGEENTDACLFRAAFPSLPLAGFWANGEIGPKALARAAPEQATRTGNATVQGFTAVFGIFRAPVPSRHCRLDALGDEELPNAIAEWLARLAREAKSRGEAALGEDDLDGASGHLARARSLFDVPSVAVVLGDMFKSEIAALSRRSESCVGEGADDATAAQ